MRVIVGIDPGAKYTSVVARRGGDVLTASVFTKEDQETTPDYCKDVGERTLTLCRKLFGEPLIGIENVVPPTGQLGKIDPAYLIETARMAGWLHALLEQDGFQVVLVEPDSFGRASLDAYPSELVGKRETTGTGKGRFQHARAAWDCSLAAPTYGMATK